MSALQWLAENISEWPGDDATGVLLIAQSGDVKFYGTDDGQYDFTVPNVKFRFLDCGRLYSRLEWEIARSKLAALDPHQPGAKLDAGKNRVWLMLAGFANALDEVARVTTKGAEKYTPNGWISVSNAQERYMDAFGRHMVEFGKGELFDEETGCRHKAQMIWNLLASLELEMREHE